MNTFTIDTDEYYPVCYKVNDAKTFKNILYYFMLPNHHVYIACRMARLTWAHLTGESGSPLKNIADMELRNYPKPKHLSL